MRCLYCSNNFKFNFSIDFNFDFNLVSPVASTAVQRNGEKCGKISFCFARNFILAERNRLLKLPTHQKNKTLCVLLSQQNLKMNQIFIRAYNVKNYNTLCDLLNLNIPKYFAVEEYLDFKKYLNEEVEDYFVVETDHVIVGCGGINYNKIENTAMISWDIIHPEYQGIGIGGSLLKHRINFIKQNYASYKIMVRTSQLAYKFYEKQGFKLLEKHKDFWAEGFDMYKMEYHKL